MGRSGASIHSRRPRLGGAIDRPNHVRPHSNPESDAEQQPPLGGWPRLYAIVIGELVLLIVLFTLFARAFR